MTENSQITLLNTQTHNIRGQIWHDSTHIEIFRVVEIKKKKLQKQKVVKGQKRVVV